MNYSTDELKPSETAKQSPGFRRQQIIRLMHDYLPSSSSQQTQDCAATIIGALLLGPDEEKISECTGVDLLTVKEIGERMRQSELWTDTGTNYEEWSASKEGVVNFLLNLAVAEGWLIRTNSKKNGQHIYVSLVYQGSPSQNGSAG